MTREELSAAVVREARRWIGTPYVHQASTIGHGCDCAGLVRGVWRAIVGPEPETLPRYTRDWGEIGSEEAVIGMALRHLEPSDGGIGEGDVLVFRWHAGTIAKHLGIAAGPASFIHAWERADVNEAALVPQWRSRIAAKFRFPLKRGRTA
jgi:NlpC/P60 family putative phage cell wall peptidase